MKVISILAIVLSLTGVAQAKEKAGAGMKFCSCGSQSAGAGKKYTCSKSVLCKDCCETTQLSAPTYSPTRADSYEIGVESTPVKAIINKTN